MKKYNFPWRLYLSLGRFKLVIALLALAAGTLPVLALRSERQDLFLLSFFLLGLTVLAFGMLFDYLLLKSMSEVFYRAQEMRSHLEKNSQLDLEKGNEIDVLTTTFRTLQKTLSSQESQLQQQSKDAQRLLNLIPTPIVIADKFHTYKQFNQSFEQTFLSSYETPPSAPPKLWKHFDQKIIDLFTRTQIENKEFSLGAILHERTKKYFEITTSPVTNAKNEVIAVLAVFHDMTQTKLNEKSRSEFVTNVSHEIRTPLTSIKGYAQLLNEHQSEVGSPMQSAINKINENCDRLNSIVHNLLRLSLIDSSQRLQTQRLKLREIMPALVAQIRQKYPKLRITVAFTQEFEFEANPKLIEQVFHNLLDNAVKYNDKKDVSIQIQSVTLEDTYQIRVHDNGPGVSAPDRPRLFERFYRGDHQKRKIEGTGLGLAIVKHILQKHEGSVSADDSQILKGACFTLSLPKIKRPS